MRRTFFLHVPTLLISLASPIPRFFLLCLFCLQIPTQVHAATSITPTPGAGNLGTTITQTGNVYGITGGKTVGTNLFHSFGQFGVATGDTAQFQTSNLTPNAAMSNILGRVTGGNPSAIFGAIDSVTYYPNANLFLMNPAGFLFGPNAAVNVGGMMHATTADYLKLADGNLFRATPEVAADAILTTSPVAAYGFLGSNPAAISIQGSTLQVAEGKSLSFVGGNQGFTATDPDTGNPIAVPGGITITGGALLASAGQINLASVASPGELLTGILAQAPNINGQSFANLGAVNITDQSVIDVSGNGGGTVLVRGGQFLLDNSTISANVTGSGPIINGAESIGSGIDVQVSGDAVVRNLGVLQTNLTGTATPGVQYGGVQVKGDRVEVLGTVSFEEAFSGNGDFSAFTGIRSSVGPNSSGGNSGTIRLDANSVLINDFAKLTTETDGGGNAGNIFVKANQNIDLDFGFITSGQSGLPSPLLTGDAGSIELTSVHGNISLDVPFITSQLIQSPGTAGSITLNATSGNIFIGEFGTISTLISPPIDPNGVPAVREGGSGSILINTTNLEIVGADISITNASNLPAGNLTMNLSGNLSIQAGSFLPTTIRVLAQGPASSAGINVTAHDVVITDGSSMSSSTLTGGDAGPLTISAVNVELKNGAQLSSASRQGLDPNTGEPGGPPPTGDAGTITIQGLTGAAQSVLIDGVDSAILTNTVGTGHGGSINIFSQSLQIQNGGTLSAATSGTAPTATGGTISVNANTVNLASGGTMTASSSGPGASGEVVVQGLVSPAQSILIDGSASGIFTDTRDTGSGGDIHLSANSVTLQNGGALSAATTGLAPSATGGMITVNAEHVAVNSQAVITAETNGIAPAGIIDINTGTLTINSGGQIRSSSGAETEPLRALAFAPAAAQPLTGGTITVQGRTGSGSQADTVTIDGPGSGVFTESTGSRLGGDITILTSQSVEMTNGAQISASSTGSGNAGNIQINAGNQLAMNSSSVTTEANQASGGAIKITTTPSGSVQLTDSTITASVLDGTGGGGSVDIDPQFVILQNSQILANSVFGPGGNISITTNLLLPDTTSVISASSQFGQQGTIVIQSPVSPASGKLVPLGQKPLIATALVSQRCAALAGGNASSFTIAGRDSLPAEPGGWVSSPLALSMAESNEGTATESALSSFSDMQKGTPLLSLRKVAPAGFLTQNFGAASSDCQS
jgi:filamentous hemagglutinin family protein